MINSKVICHHQRIIWLMMQRGIPTMSSTRDHLDPLPQITLSKYLEIPPIGYTTLFFYNLGVTSINPHQKNHPRFTYLYSTDNLFLFTKGTWREWFYQVICGNKYLYGYVYDTAKYIQRYKKLDNLISEYGALNHTIPENPYI